MQIKLTLAYLSERGWELRTAVVQEAYVQGVSTLLVAVVVQVLGLQGISKSQGSRLCQGLDAEVERFRKRPLTDSYP